MAMSGWGSGGGGFGADYGIVWLAGVWGTGGKGSSIRCICFLIWSSWEERGGGESVRFVGWRRDGMSFRGTKKGKG